MKQFVVLAISLLCSVLLSHGLVIKGTVLDENASPLGYPAVRISSKPIGALGDSLGSFVIDSKYIRQTSSPSANFKSILPSYIYFDFDINNSPNGKFEFSLPERIPLPQDAMVAIEFLENLENNHLYFKSNLIGKSIWNKTVINGYWEKIRLRPHSFWNVWKSPGSEPKGVPACIYLNRIITRTNDI